MSSSSSSSSHNNTHRVRKSGKNASKRGAKFKLVGPGATVPRLWAGNDSQIYKVVQTIPEAIVQQSSSVVLGGLYNTLQQVAQYSTFTNLFDQYRIAKVRVVFRPMFVGGTSITASSTFYMPQLWVVADYDDVSTPSNLATLQSYANCQTSMSETQIIEYAPHTAVAAYAGAFTSYGNETGRWFDAASPAVQHYGLKYGIDSGGSGQVNFQSWTVNTQLHLEFRNVR
jgi:hypothetical protein